MKCIVSYVSVRRGYENISLWDFVMVGFDSMRETYYANVLLTKPPKDLQWPTENADSTGTALSGNRKHMIFKRRDRQTLSLEQPHGCDITKKVATNLHCSLNECLCVLGKKTQMNREANVLAKLYS